jgi:hypothetical protein
MFTLFAPSISDKEDYFISSGNNGANNTSLAFKTFRVPNFIIILYTPANLNAFNNVKVLILNLKT